MFAFAMVGVCAWLLPGAIAVVIQAHKAEIS